MGLQKCIEQLMTDSIVPCSFPLREYITGCDICQYLKS